MDYKQQLLDLDLQRQFLRGDLWADWSALETDQRKNLPVPPVQKPCPSDALRLALPAPETCPLAPLTIAEAIRRRGSRRQYTGASLSLEEVSFLLWATQGVREVIPERGLTRRTVPSGGSRHPFETYLSVHNVSGLDAGMYRYQPLEHELCRLPLTETVRDHPEEAGFLANSAVVFIWTAIPYRTEWRYGPLAGKLIAQDSGHVCQNLYLACEAIGAGTCAVGAYDQKAMDALVGVDGHDEFVVYAAPVGKVA